MKQNKPITKGTNTVGFHSHGSEGYLQYPSSWQQSRTRARGAGGREGGVIISGVQGFSWEDEKVVTTESGDSCTTLYILYVTESYTEK